MHERLRYQICLAFGPTSQRDHSLQSVARMERNEITDDVKTIEFDRTPTTLCDWSETFRRRSSEVVHEQNAEYRVKQRQLPERNAVLMNELLEKTIDKSVYVDVLKIVCGGSNQTCPLFTPDGKLISYDGVHLAKYGALYLGNLLFHKRPLSAL